MAEFKDTLKKMDKKLLKPIEADNEKDYLRKLKKKGQGFLISGLSVLEKERIARFVKDRFNEVKTKHTDLADKMQKWDETFRMEKDEIIGSDGTMPNHRSPLSTVALEVMHAQNMNILFTPKDLARALPTESNDVSKVPKLDTFMNWSVDNELDLETQADRLFHSSAKNGEAPYLVHWVKEYGTEIKRKLIPNPEDPTKPLIDPDTKKPLVEEVEEMKLLYNGPKLEVFSRRDYFQPLNAIMDKVPDWEMRRIRLTYDQYLRDEMQGKFFKGSIKDIEDWGNESFGGMLEDFDGDTIPTGKWEKEFIEFYGRMRINIIKGDNEDDTVEVEELEDEFIIIIQPEDETLCSIRRNRFPMKMRPIGVDYFIPDDEGRRAGLGMMEMMEALQSAYDILYNQFLLGASNSNNPIIFYEPTGNTRNEKIKIQNGFMYPTSNANSMQFLQFPSPNEAIGVMLELINQWAQLLFGISDFSAGQESTIDPSAPAKKVEIIVAQGNVRMNAIIKRRVQTLKDILLRWFLLYKENMPPNKFMRIAGGKDEVFKFEPVSVSDFQLNGLPDFELVGNVQNMNKSMEVNKAVAVYQLLATNPFFNPQTPQGQQSLYALTKWFITKLDELGLDRFLPEAPGDLVYTPEEENARFLQGDAGEPKQGEDHKRHLEVHSIFVNDSEIPDELKQAVVEHIKLHVNLVQQEAMQQMVMQQIQPQGGQGGAEQQTTAAGQAPQGTPTQVLPGQPAGMAGR